MKNTIVAQYKSHRNNDVIRLIVDEESGYYHITSFGCDHTVGVYEINDAVNTFISLISNSLAKEWKV